MYGGEAERAGAQPGESSAGFPRCALMPEGSTVVTSDRTRGNGHKFQHRTFYLCTGKQCFALRVTED